MKSFFLIHLLCALYFLLLVPLFVCCLRRDHFQGELQDHTFGLFLSLNGSFFFSIKEPNPLTNHVSKISVINTVFSFFSCPMASDAKSSSLSIRSGFYFSIIPDEIVLHFL